MHETQEEVEVQIDEEASSAIILYNDDVNTFEHVIECLIDVCRHTSVQAEQVAWIVHTKGKCDVKHGTFDKLHPLCRKLQDRGLAAVIES